MFTSIKSSGIFFSAFKVKSPEVKPQDVLETVLVVMRFFFPVRFLPSSRPPRCTLKPAASSPLRRGMDSGRPGSTALRWLSTARGAQALGAPKPQTGHLGAAPPSLPVSAAGWSPRGSWWALRSAPRFPRRSGSCRCPAPARRTHQGSLDGAELRPCGLRRRQEWAHPRHVFLCAGDRWAGVGRRAPGAGRPPASLLGPRGSPERASGAPPPAGLRRAGLPGPGPPDRSSGRGF